MATASAVALLVPTQAQAQGQPLAPTREQIEQRPPDAPAPPPARLDVQGDIERAPCALARPEYQDISFTPTEIVFEDLKGLPPEALRSAYAEYIGTRQPVAVVCEIRDRAATILREAGYIASVEVPEQRIAEGRIRFQVLTAKMVAIRVRGSAGRAERQIARYLEPLTRQEAFNKFEAERALLLAGDLPGYSVRLALKPAGQGRGEVIGEVTVLHTPFMIDANVQNYGSQELGRWGAMIRGTAYGLTGMGDRTTVSLYSTLDLQEQHTLSIAHDFKLGGSGLTIAGNFTYAWTDPDLGNSAFDIDGKTLFATLLADYPLIRSQTANVHGTLGFDLINQDVDISVLGVPAELSRDRLRVAFLRFSGDLVDETGRDRRYTLAEPRWRLGATVEIRQGLDIFGASDDCRDNILGCVTGGAVPPSRLEGNPTATVFRGSLYGEFRPVPRLTFAVGGRAQRSGSPLASFEEFSAGNYTIGRGYDAGAIQGDRGVALQGELRYGSVYPDTSRDLALEPFLFVDQAWAWNEDKIFPTPRQELTSIGAGVRAGLGDQFRLDVTFAKPLDRVGLLAEKPDSRLLFSLSSRLWPWSFK